MSFSLWRYRFFSYMLINLCIMFINSCIMFIISCIMLIHILQNVHLLCHVQNSSMSTESIRSTSFGPSSASLPAAHIQVFYFQPFSQGCLHLQQMNILHIKYLTQLPQGCRSKVSSQQTTTRGRGTLARPK